jgi:Glycosyl transferase family 64 domain
MKEHHYQYHHHRHSYNIASFCQRIIISQTTRGRKKTKLTSQEWILHLLVLSFLLFVSSATILVIWMIFFPQDSPSTHIDLFLRSRSGNNKNKNNDMLLLPPIPLPLLNVKVSVVIMNHNRPRLLQQSLLLPTLLAHPNVDEILLAHSNPATQFDYYNDYYNHAATTAGKINQTTTTNNITNNKIVNINAIQTNLEMGLSLRFHYCAQQARNDFVMIIDDDQEMTLDAISRLILEFNNYSNNGTTILHDNDGNDVIDNNNVPYNPYRIIGRYGRVYHEDSTWWSWYHTANHGYDTRTYTGRVEVVLTKFMMLHRTTCQAFFHYQHVIWNDLVKGQEQKSSGPLWNGEDIFMSLVANHLYQKHQLLLLQQQQQKQHHQSFHKDIIIPYNNYATSSFDVWEAPPVDEEQQDDTKNAAAVVVAAKSSDGSGGSSSSSSSNSKTGISGNMDRHILFWNVGWIEYWQIKARARAHIHYRGLIWFTARQRLAALLVVELPSPPSTRTL